MKFGPPAHLWRDGLGHGEEGEGEVGKGVAVRLHRLGLYRLVQLQAHQAFMVQQAQRAQQVGRASAAGAAGAVGCGGRGTRSRAVLGCFGVRPASVRSRLLRPRLPPHVSALRSPTQQQEPTAPSHAFAQQAQRTGPAMLNLRAMRENN